MATTSYDPGPQIATLGPVTLGTPNLEKSVAFFRDIMGMEAVLDEGDAVYLRGYQELVHHSLVLRRSPEAVVETFSFRVNRPEDVELYHDQLVSQDIEVLELPAGHEAGRGTAIRFIWPGAGHPIELFYDLERPLADPEIRSQLPSNSSTRRGLGIRRLDHYNMQCSPREIVAAEAWLRTQFGFKRREYMHVPQNNHLIASWMSVTPQVHDLAIASNAEEKSAQMHHIAFNIENHSDLLVAADILRDYDVTYDMGPGKHGVGQAMYLYLREPGSGHRIEIYAGGYFIFDPDWEAIEWTPANLGTGFVWYGDAASWDPDSPMASTTGSAALTPSQWAQASSGKG